MFSGFYATFRNFACFACFACFVSFLNSSVGFLSRFWFCLFCLFCLFLDLSGICFGVSFIINAKVENIVSIYSLEYACIFELMTRKNVKEAFELQQYLHHFQEALLRTYGGKNESSIFFGFKVSFYNLEESKKLFISRVVLHAFAERLHEKQNRLDHLNQDSISFDINISIQVQVALFSILHQKKPSLICSSFKRFEIDHRKEVDWMWDSISRFFSIPWNMQHGKEVRLLFKLFCFFCFVQVWKTFSLHHVKERKSFCSS